MLDQQGLWSKVRYGSLTGYMMTVFLANVPEEPEDDPMGGATLEERVTNLEKRVTALEMGGGGVG